MAFREELKSRCRWCISRPDVAPGALSQGRAVERPSGEYRVKGGVSVLTSRNLSSGQRKPSRPRGSPLTYCTIGEDPFRGALDESLKRKDDWRASRYECNT